MGRETRRPESEEPCVELEHGRVDPETDVSDDDPLITGAIALAHLREIPDYYMRLAEMEAEAES